MPVTARAHTSGSDVSEPRRTGPLWAVLLSLLLIFSASVLPLALGFSGPSEGDALSLLVPLYGFVLPWILLWAWVTKRERRPFSEIGFRGPVGQGLGVGAVVAFILLAIAVGPLIVSGRLRFVPGTEAVMVWVAMLAGFFLQGGAEEVVFRGWLLDVLRHRMALPLAMALQTVAFMVPHVANPEITLVGFMSVALAGLAFGVMRIWSGSLWVPIAAHAVWNWAQAALLGFNVSGVPTRGWSLLEPHFSEGTSVLVSGGENGIEGMITALISLAVVTLVLFFLHQRAGQRSDRAA